MSKKSRRREREMLRRMGFSATIVPMHKNNWYTEPEDTNLIADQIFGGKYYCVGDRKVGRSVENR